MNHDYDSPSLHLLNPHSFNISFKMPLQNHPERGRGRGRGRGKPRAKGGSSRTKSSTAEDQKQQNPTPDRKQNTRGRGRASRVPKKQKDPPKQNPQKPETKPKPKPKPKPTLNTLPAELRWKIYHYLFEPIYRVEIQHLKHKTADHSIRIIKRLYHQPLRPRNPQTQSPFYNSYHNEKQQQQGRALPLSLIRSCKTIYRETILHLYTNTQFVFSSTRALSRFLHTTSADAKTCIRHVELNHIMYNEPRLQHHRLFKHRSDLAWYLAVEDLAVTCKGLRVLHVHLRIWDWPIRLEVGERWSWPLLTFERYGNRVDFASVWLEMGRFGDEVLRSVATEVERRIMVPERFRVREEERLARKARGNVKASRVLKLVF